MAKARSGNRKRTRIAVVGAGHMGKALAEGLLVSGVRPKDLIVADRSLAKTDAFFKRGVETALNAWYPAEWGNIIFLAVPPGAAVGALALMKPYLKGKLLVSLVAGLTVARLKKLAGRGARVARIMPNLPVAYGAGVIGVFFDPSCKAKERETLLKTLEGLGAVHSAEREEDLVTITTLSGSGPGVVSYLIEAVAAFGAKKGLSKKGAEHLARETFRGTAVYLAESGLSALSMQKAVATKGGVTEAILRELKKERVHASLARGLKKGIARIRKM